MRLGICASCRQRNELHEGTDGKGYCETCLAKNKNLDPMAAPVEGGSVRFTPVDRKQEYLEYIIKNVNDEWIESFLDEWKNEMRRSYSWVSELRKIDDDMKLLRLAAELGYGKVKKFPFTNKEDMVDGRKKKTRKDTSGDKATPSS